MKQSSFTATFRFFHNELVLGAEILEFQSSINEFCELLDGLRKLADVEVDARPVEEDLEFKGLVLARKLLGTIQDSHRSLDIIKLGETIDQ